SPINPRVEFSAKAGSAFAKSTRNILRDVTFHIDEGSTLGLIGESGSGKTTIARCIAGLLKPSSGSISLAGVPISDGEQNRRRIGTSIQLLFQNHSASLDPRL